MYKCQIKSFYVMELNLYGNLIYGHKTKLTSTNEKFVNQEVFIILTIRYNFVRRWTCSVKSGSGIYPDEIKLTINSYLVKLV